MITSTGGLGWERNRDLVVELLETPDYETADAWIAAHEGTDSYIFSKQAANGYVARQALPLLARGIRINAVLPGPVLMPEGTPSAEQQAIVNATLVKREGTVEELARAIVFLLAISGSFVSARASARSRSCRT